MHEQDFEHTITQPVELQGTGLHTGVECRLRLCSAPAGMGVVFRRTDLDGFQVEACAENIARVSYATSLMKRGVLISTTEHLLAALYGASIDNVVVEMDNIEVPILDGSSAPFLEALSRAGRKRQRRRRRFLQLLVPVEVSQLERDGAEKFIGAYPLENGAGSLEIDDTIDFPHPQVGRQQLRFTVTPETFAEQLGRARTFTFRDEVDKLREMGLIRGGSLDCAVVVDRGGVMNQEGLRYSDEFVRHKTLDLIGDLALLGRPLLARVCARRAGHALHTALVGKLLQTSGVLREVTTADLRREPAPAFSD